MRIIRELSDEIRENIHEAREKIRTAYILRDECRQAADWYRDMANAHLNFNQMGHDVVAKAINDWKASGKNADVAPGMMAVYNDIHAQLTRDSAEVKAMIDMYGK